MGAAKYEKLAPITILSPEVKFYLWEVKLYLWKVKSYLWKIGMF